jgi:hypothetical protein
MISHKHIRFNGPGTWPIAVAPASLFGIVVSGDNQSPPNRPFVEGMMVVTLRRKGLMRGGRYFPATSRTSIDTGHGGMSGGPMIGVEAFAVQ